MRRRAFMKCRSTLALFCFFVLLGGYTPDSQPLRAISKEGRRPIRRVRVGGVSRFFPRVLDKAEPVYPRLARQRKIQGTVIFEILISAEGSVASARLISGHPLLATPAREAVLLWRYEPPRFNGESVEVITTAAVTFALPTLPGDSGKTGSKRSSA